MGVRCQDAGRRARSAHTRGTSVSWWKGSREHGLPADTVEVLEAIEVERDPDAERDRNRRMLRCEEGG